MMRCFKSGKLQVKVYHDRAMMGNAAGKEGIEAIKQLFKEKETVNIMFAAAPSQNEVLACLCEAEDVDFSRVNAFHMDEYIGLDADAPQGFGNFLKDRLFSKLPFRNVYYLAENGGIDDGEGIAARYEKILEENPIDICFMGIGENGHIAFNDPAVAEFEDARKVKVVELDDKCRQQQVNDGCFGSISLVPTHAVTVTIPALISAEYVFCTVPARTKAEAVYETINGEISTACPATILRTHDKAVLYLEPDSAALI